MLTTASITLNGKTGLCPLTNGVAQSPPVLGYAAAKNANPERLDIFKRGLTELGYVEGKNILIEYREGVL